MHQYTALRSRILSLLTAAGLAQGCGGMARDEPGGDEGGTASGGAATGGSAGVPGCTPVTTTSERVDAIQLICGGSYCTEFPDTRCLTETEVPSALRACAAPHEPGTCPPAGDIAPDAAGCSAVTGEAYRTGERCCYPTTRLSCAVPGRALQSNGEPVLPHVVVGEALGSIADAALDPTMRAALAELWLEGARYEHASVASFARSSFQLMALGAPIELVQASQQASLDEIEHARLCFALASRFAGKRLEAGVLPACWGEQGVDLGAYAEENVVGGCVGETVAALTAAEQLERATDPEVRAALETIARDERRHAELAWRIAAWTSRAGGPPVRARMRAAFARALNEPSERRPDHRPLLVREGLGQLTAVREEAIRRRVLSDVVAPCAAALT